jgi:hypothetical protein
MGGGIDAEKDDRRGGGKPTRYQGITGRERFRV